MKNILLLSLLTPSFFFLHGMEIAPSRYTQQLHETRITLHKKIEDYRKSHNGETPFFPCFFQTVVLNNPSLDKQSLQTIAPKEYANSLYWARCKTATECCLAASTLACLISPLPILTTCPITKAACTGCCCCLGSIGTYCCHTDAAGSREKADLWKLLIPKAVHMQ